jgi:hypothetical protein
MAATLTTQDQILKTQFLELLKNQVNTKSDVLYNMIKTSEKNIDAYQVVKSAPYGINGGASAGTETGLLPTAGENFYQKFTSTTKNYYGQLQIGDKVMKATKSNKGAFIDALVSEMEGLKGAAQFIYGRDLYNDSTGILGTCVGAAASTSFEMDDVRFLIEGMTVDLLESASAYAAITNGTGRRVKSVNRATKTVTLTGTATVTVTDTTKVVTQNSYNLSLSGLKDLFKSSGSLYGVDRATNPWMIPSLNSSFGAVSDSKIQGVIADIEDFKGGIVNYIGVSTDVEGFYMQYMEATRRNVNTMEVAGGYKAIAFKDIPMKRNRFLASGTMDFLDTNKFTFHVLSDWDWITGDGGAILQQVAGYPIYAASLAKYGELICDHPGAQGRMTGVLAAA